MLKFHDILFLLNTIFMYCMIIIQVIFLMCLGLGLLPKSNVNTVITPDLLRYHHTVFLTVVHPWASMGSVLAFGWGVRSPGFLGFLYQAIMHRLLKQDLIFTNRLSLLVMWLLTNFVVSGGTQLSCASRCAPLQEAGKTRGSQKVHLCGNGQSYVIPTWSLYKGTYAGHHKGDTVFEFILASIIQAIISQGQRMRSIDLAIVPAYFFVSVLVYRLLDEVMLLLFWVSDRTRCIPPR